MTPIYISAAIRRGEKMSYRDITYKVREILKAHHKWFDESLPLIASENITSPMTREAIASDLSHRYAEGEPGNRFYQGCKYIDEIETIAIELAKKLFNAEYVNVQPTSGTIANLATFVALTKPGDTMFALEVPHGGHISHSKFSVAGIYGLKVKGFPFDFKEMNIDVEKSRKKIRETKPKLLLFGGSVFLFPHPIKELKEVAEEVGAHIAYDAAHVLGLIAGKQFQQPFEEGADVITSSRHKTFPGPQGGIILARKEFEKKIKNAVFPGVVSNHHLHHIAGLAVTLAEMLEFGEQYAKQVIKNARTLAQALYERGFNVLCEHKNFTASHQVVVDVKEMGGGKRVAELLERANIIINKNLLPWDDIHKPDRPSGIRLGTQELTRLGMKESEMQEIAEFFKRLILDGEKVENVKHDVIELRKEFRKVKYCFTEGEAYEYKEF